MLDEMILVNVSKFAIFLEYKNLKPMYNVFIFHAIIYFSLMNALLCINLSFLMVHNARWIYVVDKCPVCLQKKIERFFYK